MSDFDKEAERERLREKYEREEEKREVTEQMSELLLKGATMTNAHCQDCGDPIFRYDGQEFCPTCEKAVQRSGGGADGEETDAAASANGEENIEVATPDEASRVQFGANDADEPEAPESATETTEQPDTTEQATEPQAPEQAEPQRSAQAPPAGSDSPGDIAAAHDSLSRTVTQLARQAEAVDDLGRKRDLLEATREAAEALAAVRETTR